MSSEEYAVTACTLPLLLAPPRPKVGDRSYHEHHAAIRAMERRHGRRKCGCFKSEQVPGATPEITRGKV